MISLKSKLDSNLRIAIDNKYYKNYRVLIYCKNMCDKIYKKLISHKCSVVRYIPSVQCISANISSRIIERLIEYPQVDYITFDDYAVLCSSSISSANRISSYKKYKFTGNNINIGIIDTGIYPHPDIMNPENKILKFADLINNYQYPYDDHGHGTFVSGLICGSGFSSNGMYKGIAEKSKIYMIKAFNRMGKAYISDILFSIDKLIQDSEENNIRVFCLPFELINNDYFVLKLFKKLFDKALSKNIIIIVPAGNNGCENNLRGISTLSNCLTVAGIDTRNAIIKPCSFSSSGPLGKLDKPDLSAASEDLCSLKSDIHFIPEINGRKTYPKKLDNPYTSFSGTSCSAAFIAGICALLIESNNKLTFKDISSILKISCSLQNFSKWNQGAGMLNIDKCPV